MRKRSTAMLLAWLSVLGGTALRAAEPPVVADVLLKGGTVIDGTGAARRQADVALRGDRIVAVGTFPVDPRAKVIDASSLIVAPGFIDLHSHSDEGILQAKKRSNTNYQTQGVTTVVTGNCGGGAAAVGDFLAAVDKQGAGTNVIHLIPHGALRASVMGNGDRRPTTRELETMVERVERGMRDGAWGLSTGLIYVPSRYADVAELVALSKVVARHGGFYASHIRDEGAGLLASIDEALMIGREAGLPVHVSHLKANGKANWGLARSACERIADARKAGQAVTADQYPYVASSTSLAAMVLPDWAIRDGTQEFTRIAADPVLGKKLREETQQALDEREQGASIRIARYAHQASRVGRSLTTIAREEASTPLEVVLDIQRHGGAQAVSFGMSEADVRAIMAHDFVATASDGSAHVPNSGDQPHPRAYGTFPRKVRYALDEKTITLEQAIRSATGLPAAVLRLPDRGVIRPGACADVVVFDPATFRDAATFDHPTQYAPGVKWLFVNGVAVIDEGKPVKKLPGRALRPATDGPADLVVKAGRIWTGDPEHPWAEALAARSGAIVAVGSEDDVAHFQGPLTRVLSNPAAFVLPGLIDAHAHLISLGEEKEQIDLRGIKSVDEVALRVKDWSKAHPGDSWILGQNWDQSLWPGGAFPTSAALDAAAPDRPVWLTRIDGHAGWANAEALRRAKINSDTRPPVDGQILRDSDGRPTGVFIDGAMVLVSRWLPRPTLAELERQILTGQNEVFRWGLTAIHDAGIAPYEAEAYRALDHAGRLKLRVYGMAKPAKGGEVAFASHPPLPAKPGARFEYRAIKIFIDGAMGSRGGLLFEPYSDDSGNKGLLLTDPKTLEATTVEALKHGWQIATHAIGDRGNALVLDAYAAALRAVPEKKDPRLRIEHAQVVRKEDVSRFAALGLIASMQPSHASDDMRWADARLGPGRVEGAYAWRWFLDAKVPLAFGSDFPVEIVNPFYGIYAALTRQDEKGEPPGGWHPDQRMTLEETLRGFTAGAAYAAFAEERLGVLKAGLRADLTIVDRDLFKSSPLDVLKTKVLATVVDGETVYEAR
ncbi:MAG: amidohydrolase family protein [Isosphaeraceae bacterium]|nr:amidohydrolase family protein [Isosphaeraceae bacterium]